MAKRVTLAQLTGVGLDKSEAVTMLQCVQPLLESLDSVESWRKITSDVLNANQPFPLHKLLHEVVFSDWDVISKGPIPAWFPSESETEDTNIYALMRMLNLDSYEALHTWSVQNRDEFFEFIVKTLDIRFKKPFNKIVTLLCGSDSPQWLFGAKLNIVESCFNAPPDAPAIVFQPEGELLSTTTYSELESLSNRVANSLVQAGFNPGDSIAIDMPMNATSVAIYLGIIKIGCKVISIADSFAPHEIEMRLKLANAKAIFTQDFIPRSGTQLPLYTKVVAARSPRAIVLSSSSSTASTLQLRTEDVRWEEFLSEEAEFDPVSCNPHTHTNILFSSGTTGTPKAIPWTHTTPIKCAMDGYLHHNIQAGDVLAWPTNLGWMMGPWLIYASLINKGTIALYEGVPTDRAFGQFVQNANVTMLGVVPSLVRTWKTTNCMNKLDWTSIKSFSSTGECSSPEDMLFLMSLGAYRPVIEYCGGTEIGGSYITGTVLQPAAPATFTTPALGLDFVILDRAGKHTDNGEGFLIPPSIGLSTELLNGNHHDAYFEGNPTLPKIGVLRCHGDQIERLPGGYYRMHGRMDDTMNLSGIKVSSAEIEEVLNAVSGIRETAAVAVSPKGGGPSQLVIHAVLAPDSDSNGEALKASMQATIRKQLNPLFKIHNVVIRNALPRTPSNKIVRRLLREETVQPNNEN